MPKPISIDEILSCRKDTVRSTPHGDALVKAFKAPPSWNEKERSAKFVMSTEQPDRMGDIVVQSGLDISEFEKNPVALLFHNSRDWPIGQWKDVKKVSGKPRRTEGTLSFLPDGFSEESDKAVKYVEAGIVRAVSIGFVVREAEWIVDEEKDRWIGIRFLESELIECSLVPIPANPGAVAKMADGDRTLHKDLLEEILDDWARTPTGLIVPRADYESSYQEVARAVRLARTVPPVVQHREPVVTSWKTVVEDSIEAVAEVATAEPETADGQLKSLLKAVLKALRGDTATATVEAQEEPVVETKADDQEVLELDPEAFLKGMEELDLKTVEEPEPAPAPEIAPEDEAESVGLSEKEKAIKKAEAFATLARLRSNAA